MNRRGDCLKHWAFKRTAIRLSGLESTRELLEPLFFNRNHELFVIAMCDDNLNLIGLLGIPGMVDRTVISLRKALRVAVASECTGLVLAHNHPSGQLRPSQTDLKMTQRFAVATESLDIQILDHLIFNQQCPPFSFRQHGLV